MVNAAARGAVWAVLPFARMDVTLPEPAAEQCARFFGWRARQDALPEALFAAVQQEDRIYYGKERTLEEIRQEAARKKEANQRQPVPARAPLSTVIDEALAVAVEAALQAHGQVGRLVDRALIKATLAELKLNTLMGVNEFTAGPAGRLVGADWLLMGAVSREAQGWRLNMQLVNAHSSVVMDAREAACAAETDLADLARTSALLLAGRARKPPAFPPSPAWQRRREAGFFGEFLMDEHGDRQWRLEIPMLNRVEIVYLLQGDQPELLDGHVIAPLMQMLYRWVCHLDSPEEIDPTMAGVATALLDHLLSSVEYDGPVYAPLLTRAQAWGWAGYYEKAMELAQRSLREYPGASPGWAKFLLAACLLKLDRPMEALPLAREAADIFERGMREHCEWEGYAQRCIWRLLANIAQDDRVRDENQEFRALQHEFKQQLGLWAYDVMRYLMLLKKREGMEKVASLNLTKLREETGNAGLIPVEALRGDYLLQWGRTEEAIRAYQAIIVAYPGYDGIQTTRNYGRTQLTRIEQQTGRKGLVPADVHPSVAIKDVCRIPDKYKVYCFPVGNADTGIVYYACQVVEEWFGTKVVIKDATPIPVGAFNEAEERHSMGEFSRQLLQNTEIPDDTLFTFYITGEKLTIIGGQSAFAHPWGGNPVVGSYYNRGGYQPQTSDKQELGRALGQGIAVQFKKCMIFPCPTDWLGWERGVYCKNPLCGDTSNLCSACAQKYKANFEQCHRALQNFKKLPFKMLSWQFD
ncbi:MAG: hypothetical protein NTV49_04885 [Kiritimatiellaeota bacterium]|nr:hypothetical protein [Kiritimatiellota bacterium]